MVGDIHFDTITPQFGSNSSLWDHSFTLGSADAPAGRLTGDRKQHSACCASTEETRRLRWASSHSYNTDEAATGWHVAPRPAANGHAPACTASHWTALERSRTSGQGESNTAHSRSLNLSGRNDGINDDKYDGRDKPRHSWTLSACLEKARKEGNIEKLKGKSFLSHLPWLQKPLPCQNLTLMMNPLKVDC